MSTSLAERRSPIAGPLGSLLAALLLAAPVSAEESVAAAQLLFEQGRDLLRLGKVAQACPKLAESQRLDPATGTLLALAACHEAEGKLATAWAEFSEVEARASRDGQNERERWAREKIIELKPRLSTLELQLSPTTQSLPNLRVERNGIRLEQGAWNVPVPVDGGQYAIEVRATGYQSWRTRLTIRAEYDAQVLLVPTLRRDSGAGSPNGSGAISPPTPAAQRSDERPVSTHDPEGWTTLQWAGFAGAGAGLAAFIACGAVSYAAVAKDNEVDDCPDRDCRTTKQQQAFAYADAGTVLGVAGAVLLAAGGGLVLWGGRDDDSPSTASQIQVGVAPRTASVRFQMTFH